MDLSSYILFFCLLATFLLCLFFHSGALFCPGLFFGLFSLNFSNLVLKHFMLLLWFLLLLPSGSSAR